MTPKIEVQKQGRMIRVFIAENHLIVRMELKKHLSLQNDVTVAGEAIAGLNMLRILRQESSFDLLLIDPNLSDIDGFELIARIHSQNTSPPILVFSMHNESLVVKRALQLGASGFVTKGCTQDTLITAIRTVASGERFVDPMLTEAMIFENKDAMKKVPNTR